MVLVLGVALFLADRLMKSEIDRAWRGIREDRLAPHTAGLPVWRYVMLAFVVFVWKAQGQTILLVEQNVRIALELADNAYALQHSQVIAQGAAQIWSNSMVRQAYLGAA
ncbi:MAG: hypothetical protein ACSLEN_07025 [Candidatus Malihini olakiniferum]